MPVRVFLETWVIDVHAVTAFASSHVFFVGNREKRCREWKGIFFSCPVIRWYNSLDPHFVKASLSGYGCVGVLPERVIIISISGRIQRKEQGT